MYSQSIKQLTLHRFVLTYRAKESVVFPEYPFSMIRGCFGEALSQLEKESIVKEVNQSKVSDYLFNNQLSTEHPWQKEYSEPPRGFWFSSIDKIPSSFLEGDLLTFQITLCGSYGEFMKLLVPVFLLMGRNGMGKPKGRFELLSIDKEHTPDRFSNLWDLDNKTFISISKGIELNDFTAKKINSEELELFFNTPFSMNKQFGLYGGISFKNFMELLAIRMTLLSNIYCDSDFDWDGTFDETNIKNIYIKESHLSWKVYMRFSNRKQEKAPISGYIGKVCYSGEGEDLQTYLPLLLLGQYTHAGRNIIFGGGQYNVNHEHFSSI
jgi:hypothetical protein